NTRTGSKLLVWLAYKNEVKLIDITNTPDNVN
ncbi:phage tail protein, partial [Salmonella enterica]|nr:phage tail protein [Salmonella enterica]